MKKISMALALAAGTTVSIGWTFALPVSPAAAIPVFDATNYAQNLLQAARALEQINHQISSLQNEAAMLQNMAKNLERIDFPQLEQINSAMQRIDRLMSQAQGIDFRGINRPAQSETPRQLFAAGLPRRVISTLLPDFCF